MRIAESELIINEDGSCFHLHLRPEELAKNIILVGDPGRVELIDSLFESIEFKRSSREFNTIVGKYNGKRVMVLSTGIGTDNIDIVMNELDALANIDFSTREIKKRKTRLNILRIGTSGAIQSDIPIGSYVFAKYSLGCDGLMNWYADRRRIALPKISAEFKKQVKWNRHLTDPYFIKAGDRMAEMFKDIAIMGCTVSAQGFYGPQGRILRMGLAMPDMMEDFEKFEFEGIRITNFEMESSAIAGIGRHLGHNCGTICLIIANRHIRTAFTEYKPKMEALARFVLEQFTK